MIASAGLEGNCVPEKELMPSSVAARFLLIMISVGNTTSAAVGLDGSTTIVTYSK